MAWSSWTELGHATPRLRWPKWLTPSALGTPCSPATLRPAAVRTRSRRRWRGRSPRFGRRERASDLWATPIAAPCGSTSGSRPVGAYDATAPRYPFEAGDAARARRRPRARPGRLARRGARAVDAHRPNRGTKQPGPTFRPRG